MNVLVVDDDRDFADGVSDLLALGGHSVTVVLDGEAAAQAASARSFDLCFMDLKLPGMGGIEAMSAVLDWQPQTKVLIMSAYAKPTDVGRALEKGAVDVLRKPFDARAVLQLIRRVGSRAVLLLVDDDVDFATSVAEQIRHTGYEVEHVSSAQAARERLAEAAPQMLLLDLRLGDESGADLFEAARELHPDLPIIVVTGYAMEFTHQITHMDSLSLDGLLRKPLNVPKLVERVDEVLLKMGT